MTPDATPRRADLPDWFPAWAVQLADLYFSGTTAAFVLHGNTQDVFRVRSDRSASYGVLAEFLAERSVALPPLTPASAAAMLAPLRVTETLAGLRGRPPVDLDAVIAAIVAFSVLVTDVGDQLSAFDLNPLICSPTGPLAVDALAILAPPPDR